MTYSIVVTILLIVVLTLFLVSMSKGTSLQEQHQKRIAKFKSDNEARVARIVHLTGEAARHRMQTRR